MISLFLISFICNVKTSLYCYIFLILQCVGPDFGSPPSLMRKKLHAVLSNSGKISSFIDNISIVQRYASGSSNAIPVSSDDEALSKAKKEVFFYVNC